MTRQQKMIIDFMSKQTFTNTFEIWKFLKKEKIIKDRIMNLYCDKVYNRMDRLRNKGLVNNDTVKGWFLTEKGMQAAK